MPIDWPCAGCGYNLLGQAIDGQCPECGAPISLTLDALRRARPPLSARFIWGILSAVAIAVAAVIILGTFAYYAWDIWSIALATNRTWQKLGMPELTLGRWDHAEVWLNKPVWVFLALFLLITIGSIGLPLATTPRLSSDAKWPSRLIELASLLGAFAIAGILCCAGLFDARPVMAWILTISLLACALIVLLYPFGLLFMARVAWNLRLRVAARLIRWLTALTFVVPCITALSWTWHWVFRHSISRARISLSIGATVLSLTHLLLAGTLICLAGRFSGSTLIPQALRPFMSSSPTVDRRLMRSRRRLRVGILVVAVATCFLLTLMMNRWLGPHPLVEKELYENPPVFTAFSGSGDRMVMTTQYTWGRLVLVDAMNGAIVRSFREDRDYLNRLVVSSNGAYCAAATRQMIKIWDMKSGHQCGQIDVPTADLAMTADASKLSYVDQKSVRVVQMSPEGQPLITSTLLTLGFGYQFFSAVSFSADGTLLYAADNNGIVRIVNLETRRVVTLPSFSTAVSRFFPCPGNRFVAIAEKVRVISDDGTVLRTLALKESAIRSPLAVSHDGKYLGYVDDGVFIVRLEDAKQVAHFRRVKHVLSLSFSPDDQSLITLDLNGRLNRWPLPPVQRD